LKTKKPFKERDMSKKCSQCQFSLRGGDDAPCTGYEGYGGVVNNITQPK